jgi:hypothetical protein
VVDFLLKQRQKDYIKNKAGLIGEATAAVQICSKACRGMKFPHGHTHPPLNNVGVKCERTTRSSFMSFIHDASGSSSTTRPAQLLPAL